MGAFGGPGIVTDNLTFAIDPGSARSYPGSGTTVTDLSGTNNVTLANGVGFGSNNGGVFTYDGVDDQGSAGNFFTYQAFTINLWVKPGTSQVTYADIIDNYYNVDHENHVVNYGQLTNYDQEDKHKLSNKEQFFDTVPGDVLIVNKNTFSRSLPNTTNEDRYCLQLIYDLSV